MGFKRIPLTYSNKGPAPTEGFVAQAKPGFMSLVSALGTAIEDDASGMLWLRAGGFDLSASGAIREKSAVDDASEWTAASTGYARVSDAGVQGGVKRFVTHGESPAGIRGSLPSPPSSWEEGYTLLFPDVAPHSLAAINTLFTCGVSASTRQTCYFDTSGRIVVNHGTQTGNLTALAKNHAVDVLASIMVCYDAADDAMNIYSNGASPIFTGTISHGPPAEIAAALFGPAYVTSLTSNLSASMALIMDKPMDAKAAAIMAACASIRAYAA